MPTLHASTMTDYGRTITANISVHTKHRTAYVVAIAFIQAHGHFAAITKDGLLALSGAMWENNWSAHELGIVGDDRYFEEPHLFDVDDEGMVCSRDVREWLGY